jgi:hypothetical protein
MLAIVLSACLAYQPTVCRDYKIPVNEGIDATHCITDAPPYFAQWAEEHPGWKIKRWHCAPTSENDI